MYHFEHELDYRFGHVESRYRCSPLRRAPTINYCIATLTIFGLQLVVTVLELFVP